MSETVAILGASDNPERYAYKAFKMLQEYGHTPLPVTPKLEEIEGVPTVSKLSEISKPIDTLTMYVGPKISTQLKNEILNLKPERVIFNPGSENPQLIIELRDAGIKVLEACTLVLLKTKQF